VCIGIGIDFGALANDTVGECECECMGERNDDDDDECIGALAA
jgi:hypothetical protein